LDRPRDKPTRTAIGAAFLSWVVIVFAVGSTDRIFFRLHISYTDQIHVWRVGIWVLPIIVFFLTRGVCRSLQRSGSHPLRSWQGSVVRRRADGSYETLAVSDDRVEEPWSEPPVGTVSGHEE
jgi:ubiquinol-cytochrome c reductase cytochrome b subunit